MVKPEWGTKRVCQSCGTVYYDMKKNPATCPKCSTRFDPEALLKSRRGRTLPEEVTKTAAPEVEAAEEEVEDIEVAEGEEDEEAVIEDASELGEDEDDVALEVVEEEE